MQEISVYLNARASHSGSNFWEKEIRKRLFRSSLTFRRPVDFDELERCLNQDVDRGINTIISVGGDGTANTLIQKLAGQDIGLLVVPGGTANDLAGELGTINKIEEVITWVRAQETKKIDLIKIDDKLMATNGGIGLGGSVANRINSIRKKVPLFKKLMKMTGKNIYSFFAASELLDPNLPYYKLEITSDQFKGEIYGPGLLVNNQAKLAGNFNVAPSTCNSDGLFNVMLFTHSHRGKLIQCLWRMGQGKCVKADQDVVTFETNKLIIKNINSQTISFFGDGEILKTLAPGQECEISIKPQSLLVYSKGKGQDLVDLVNEVSLA
jgi:diacylglycerol kinase family enzyme